MNILSKVMANPLLPFAKLWEACTCIIPSDKVFLQGCFLLRFHRLINWEKPHTFNEKIQWLKIYNRNPRYTDMVDKYAVREIVKDKVDMFELLGVWDSFDEINFDQLPDQFVLKPTHDSGSIIICRDKKTFDYNATRHQLTRALNYNYFKKGREFPYKNVRRRIIAEKYMVSVDKGDMIDYKFTCFNGKVVMIFVITNRFSKNGVQLTILDREWNEMPFKRIHPRCDSKIQKPNNYDRMIYLAEYYSKDIPLLRVDFYEIDGKLYFGEFTFYPGGGLEPFQPAKYDSIIGDMLKLPDYKIQD